MNQAARIARWLGRMGRGSRSRFVTVLLLVMVALVGGMVWAAQRDEFVRVRFELKTPDGRRTPGIAVYPKPSARFPVVVYLPGSGGRLAGSGRILRTLADVGLAAVSFEYDQGSQAGFDEQMRALNLFLAGQEWANPQATAWLGHSLGAQRSLSHVLRHAAAGPQLLIRLGGGLVPEAERLANAAPASPPPIRGTVILVHGERDDVFPLAECRRLAGLLRDRGVPVETRVLRGTDHSFGGEYRLVVRQAGELCAARLPKPRYAERLAGHTLSPAEAAAFDEGMRRAGKRARELWQVLASLKEPKRRLAMMSIANMEDYDLTHITASHLRSVVDTAWHARTRYPWCAQAPREVFETYVLGLRSYEEPLNECQVPFRRRLEPVVKYCRTTEEAADEVWKWRRARAPFGGGNPRQLPTHKSSWEILRAGGGDCRAVTQLYVDLVRSVGLAARPTFTLWPTLDGANHYWVELWSPEENAWHASDAAAGNRPYSADWALRVPKAISLVPTGKRGGWNVIPERRWEDYLNTVGLFYPSGVLQARVTDADGRQASNQWVAVEFIDQSPTLIARARTDAAGEARFVLGRSAKHPYRVFLDRAAKSDWAWVEVDSNAVQAVSLRTDQHKAFDPAAPPPRLSWQTNGVDPTNP